jgi:hypothetical protein
MWSQIPAAVSEGVTRLRVGMDGWRRGAASCGWWRWPSAPGLDQLIAEVLGQLDLQRPLHQPLPNEDAARKLVYLALQNAVPPRARYSARRWTVPPFSRVTDAVMDDVREWGKRPLEDIYPEAIEAIFPKTTVQTCIVHLIRSSLKYVPRW